MAKKKLRPMLAAAVEDKDLLGLDWPLLGQPKYDGIRCLWTAGGGLSRTLKPIPNQFIQETLRPINKYLDGLDGELMVGSSQEFRATASGVMSVSGEPDFKFVVFDHWLYSHQRYEQRLQEIHSIVNTLRNPRVVIAPSYIITGPKQARGFHNVFVQDGFEGLILRNPEGHYKYGRSTLKQQFLLKFKEFSEAEAKVCGYQERMHNANEAALDARGYTERSTRKDGMVPTDSLGALVVKLPDGSEFSIGSGFTEEERHSLWQERQSLIGRLVTYRFFPGGDYNKPRFPTFKGFRND